MLQAFVYLTLCSARNRVRMRLQRLREPRYLAGFVAGVAYLYFFLVRPPRRPASAPDGVSWMVGARDAIEPIAGVILLILATLAWVFASSSRPALAFTQAEVQWLFTAPATRRQLVHYKVVRGLLPAVFTALVLTLVTRAGASPRGWIVFAGTLVALATMNLYLTGAWLGRENLRRHGRAGFVRSGLPLLFLGAALVVVAGAVAQAWPAISAVSGPAELGAIAARLGDTWPVRIALRPFTLVIHPIFAAGPGEAARALGPAVGVALLTYAWTIRSDVDFEEASAAEAERRARQPADRAVVRAPRTIRVPFALAPTGRPEAAVIWKNLISIGRYGSLRTVVAATVALVGMGFAVAQGAGGFAAGLARFAALAAGFAVFFGPQVVRNDLRLDLPHLAVLKSWPIRGAALLRGEVLGPTLFLSAIAAICLAPAVPLSAGLATRWGLGGWDRASYTIAAVLIASGLILTQVVIHNTMALIFPAWVQSTARRTRGVDMLGQQLLMMAALMLGMTIAVLPAALAGGFIALGLRAVVGFVPVVVVGAVAALVLAFQGLLIIEALGSQLDRMDVSATDPSE